MAGPDSSASGDEAMKARIVSHMNRDHAAELSLYLRAFNGLSTSASRTPAIREIFLDKMILDSASGEHEVAISPPMTSFSESRVRLVEMAKQAQQTLGLSDIKITTFTPPEGVGILITGAVLFYFVTAATRHLVLPGTAVWSFIDSFFPMGAPGYKWLVKAIFVPTVAIHLGEAYYFATSRLNKHQVETGSTIWWLWIVSTFTEGGTTFMRFDKLVKAEQAKRDAVKH